jgi:hypothetical protein
MHIQEQHTHANHHGHELLCFVKDSGCLFPNCSGMTCGRVQLQHVNNKEASTMSDTLTLMQCCGIRCAAAAHQVTSQSSGLSEEMGLAQADG